MDCPMIAKPESAGKEALIDAGRALFLEHGYVAVSMQEIAQAAGMTKGAPYYHFKNKEDLFVTVLLLELQRQTAGFVAALGQPGTVEERLTGAMAYVFDNMRADLFALFADAGRHLGPDVLGQREELRRQGDKLDEVLIPFFTAMNADGVSLRVSAAKASHFFNLLMMAQLHTLHSKKVTSQPSQTPRETAAELVDLLLNGIR
jgi:AcrR family transcriptional regulator